jgi:hypothetical protein
MIIVISETFNITYIYIRIEYFILLKVFLESQFYL